MRHEDEIAGAVARVVGWMVVAIVSAIVLVVWANGCACAPVDPPEPGPPVDSGIPETCEGAAANLEALGCVLEGVCSPGGDCADVAERCRELERDLPGYVDVPCLVRADSCADAEACAE